MIANILISGDWYPIFCATSGEFALTVDEIETTSVNSGSAREYLPGMTNGTLTWSGVSTIDNTEGKISILYLMQQALGRNVQSWRVYFEADDGTTQEATFDGFIRNASILRETTSYNNSNIVVRITGGVTLDNIILPPGADLDYFSDYWQTVDGQNYVSGASTGEWNGGTTYTLLSTDTILAVDVEGIGYNIVTGTPGAGNREVKFQTSPVRLIFPSDLVFDGSQRVYVMWKRY